MKPTKPTVLPGLRVLAEDGAFRQTLRGNIGYLCHSASIDADGRHGIEVMQALFGQRLLRLFAPQHGLLTDAQDNMIESPHFFHTHYQLPVFSLYSEVRQPAADMLSGLDHLVIDLQDVGARVYTYIYTMLLAMEACGRAGVEVVVLDRPNPLGGETVEGNILDPAFRSFIGWYPLPMRHGLTAGEIARLGQRFLGIDCDLRIVPMRGWQRGQHFEDTGLPWVLPSPNFPGPDTAFVYPGTVLLEGTSLSEGRGTVRPFELFGHPDLDPWALAAAMEAASREAGLSGAFFRPLSFLPTFDKYQGQSCYGLQIHVTDRQAFRPWRTGQLLLRECRRQLGETFRWRQPPFEYDEVNLPIDLLNGTDKLRHWIENDGSPEGLDLLEQAGRAEFLAQREEVFGYGR